MRLKARIHNDPMYQKVVIHDSGDAGVYLFLYTTLDDASCAADYWYETIQLARESAAEDYHIHEPEWEIIDDPLPGAQQDWEQPMIAIRGDDGTIKIVPYHDVDMSLTDSSSTAIVQISADQTLIQEISVLLQKGEHLQAISLYIQQMKVSLVEAKTAVAHIQEQLRTTTPNI